MNNILLSRYNKLLKNVGKKCNIDFKNYLLLFEEKKEMKEEDILNNVQTIKNVESNFANLQKNKSKKEVDLNALIKLQPLIVGEVGEQKENKLTKVLNFASQSVPKRQLSKEVVSIFGNMEGFLIDGFVLFFLSSQVVMVEMKNIFNLEAVGYRKVKLSVEKEIEHEVDYDGMYPLEELDFRQEEIANDHEEKGFEIVTKVKCSIYKIMIEVNARELKTKLHLMRTEDVKNFEKLANIEKNIKN